MRDALKRLTFGPLLGILTIYACSWSGCREKVPVPMKQPEDDGRLRFISAGVEFAVILIVFCGGGAALDLHMDTLPLWTLIGMGAGFAGALWRLVRAAMEEQRKELGDKNHDSQ